MENIIGLKELRQNISRYVEGVQRGHTFVVVKRSRPLFRIAPLDDDTQWEEVVDFTKIKKGGVKIEELLARLT